MNATETRIRTDEIASRETLKRTFQNRIRLSETHFALLIHSTLNKRDDRFHGYWREGHTYRKGDVVYYKGALWEMKADQEICGEEDNKPGVGAEWTSRLKTLEEQVGELQTDLKRLRQDFQDYQQMMEERWQRVDLQLTVLTVVLGTMFFAWLSSYLYHLWVGGGLMPLFEITTPNAMGCAVVFLGCR